LGPVTLALSLVRRRKFGGQARRSRCVATINAWYEVIDMMKWWCGALLIPALLTIGLACGGCGEGAKPAAADDAPQNAEVAESTPPGPEADLKGTQPSIRQIMNRLARPGALTTRIGEELKAAEPPWEKIQTQTEEYARLAAVLGQNSPPRGGKESWAKLCVAYADSATALDRAAQAKDREAALAAHGQLANSCDTCHREHRRMRGPGMRPGSGPPGGPAE
jgi:hypothetical protein